MGGFGNGVVAYTDGTAWMDASPDPGALAPGFNGVFMHAAHGTWIVGNNGAIYNRTADDFVDHADPPLTIRDYHGTWVDPDGGVWAVGGDLNAQTDGMVAYLGDAQIGEI